MSQPQAPMPEDRKRRTLVLAWVHVGIAVLIALAFVVRQWLR